MLVSDGSARFGSATMRSRFALAPQLSVHLVERSRLTYDVRFVPAASGRSTNALVYLLLEGAFEIVAPSPEVLEGPVAFVLHEDGFEGADGRRDLVFRSHGAPYAAIEVRLAAGDLAVPADPRPRTFTLGPSGWDAVRRAHATAPDDRGAFSLSLRAVLGALAAHGVLARDPSSEVVGEQPRYTRIWSALRPLADHFDVLPTLDGLALTSGWSVRQVAREVGHFVSTFSLPGSTGGWRQVTRRLRLKLAVLGLSAPDVTVVEVARAAGYGDAVAMARAFRDAGLPAPSDVRAALALTSS